MLCKQLWQSGSPSNLAADKKFSRSLHHRSSGANVAFEGSGTRSLRNARYVSGLLGGLLLTLSSHLHHQSKRGATQQQVALNWHSIWPGMARNRTPLQAEFTPYLSCSDNRTRNRSSAAASEPRLAGRTIQSFTHPHTTRGIRLPPGCQTVVQPIAPVGYLHRLWLAWRRSSCALATQQASSTLTELAVHHHAARDA